MILDAGAKPDEDSLRNAIWKKDKDNYERIKKEGIAQVKGYLELDKIKAISKLRSYLLIGSKDGVEFLEV